MAAADEIAVERFLARDAGFLAIPAIIESVLEKHESIADPDLDTVLAADAWARDAARRVPAGVTA
jgi:1-deoxy-D-xylulose-5-phosphate reductoisomerase